jgi:hypothetical protein
MCSKLPLVNYDNLWGLHLEIGDSLTELLIIFDNYLPKWSEHIYSACLEHDHCALNHTIKALRNFSLLLSADRLVCMSDLLCEMMHNGTINEDLINLLLSSAKETQQSLHQRHSDFRFFNNNQIICLHHGGDNDLPS